MVFNTSLASTRYSSFAHNEPYSPIPSCPVVGETVEVKAVENAYAPVNPTIVSIPAQLVWVLLIIYWEVREPVRVGGTTLFSVPPIVRQCWVPSTVPRILASIAPPEIAS